MINSSQSMSEQAFRMFFSSREHLQYMIEHDTLNVNKSTMFVLNHVINGTIDEVDFDLYSQEINLYHKMYLKIVEENKPIHGNFYNDLRQRYFDMLNCTPVENAEQPLQDSHLAWMLTKLSDDMSETKKHRWLGYIQGCLAHRGLITVNEERDNTRELFKGK